MLQRGAYLAADSGSLDHAERHRLRIHATLAGLRRPGVVSHTSAAVMHGLPLWPAAPGQVHITRRPPSSTDRSSRLYVHIARLAEADVCQVDGIPVTTVPRTLLDLGRTLPLESAVIAADFALHARLTTAAELQAMAQNLSGTPGSLVASRVVAFADGESDSVGESRSRVTIARLGLPAPALQLGIWTSAGQHVASCDFGWREERVVGEFDGKVKYDRLLKPGQRAGDAVFAEKRREDAIRDEGWEVVRWVWLDLATPHVIGERIRRAMERARRRL